MSTHKPTIITPDECDSFDFGGLGVEWKIHGRQTEGRFSIVHHPIAPRALVANWGDVSAFAAINEKYALEMRFDSVPDLCKRFDLTFPDLSVGG